MQNTGQTAVFVAMDASAWKAHVIKPGAAMA